MADDQIIIRLNGLHATHLGRVTSLTIRDELNDAPNTATLTTARDRPNAVATAPFLPAAFDAGAFLVSPTTWPVVPPVVAGTAIEIYLGTITNDALIFGGEVVTLEQVYEGTPDYVAYHLSCLDWTRRGNRKKVLKTYAQQSATAIVLDLLVTFTDRTGLHVQAGLPVIEGGITFTFEEVSRAISRIAEKIGASWYWDYTGDLHFFLDEASEAIPPLIPTADFRELRITSDLTQVRTRVTVEGLGTTVPVDVPAGAGFIPLTDGTPFSPSGGLAVTGTQRLAYTDAQVGGGKANTTGVASGGGETPPPTPVGAPTAAIAGTPGGLAGGPYQYAVTVELANGSRSAPSGLSNAVTIGSAAAGTTSAALRSPKAPGPIAVGLTAYYATTFVDAAGGETTLGTSANVTGTIVAAPTSAVGVGNATGGAQEVGYYTYYQTYLTPAGETDAGPSQTVNVTASYNATTITLRTTTDTRVVGRRLYRSSKAPSSTPVQPIRLVLEIGDNTTTTYKDVAADTNLPPTPLPAANSANDVGEAATVTLPTSSDARVTRRRLYRRDGPAPASYRLVDEIPDNTTTTFLDNRLGGTGAIAPTVNTLNTGAVQVTGIGYGPTGTVRRRLFRTKAGGTELREVVAINDNATTTWLDTDADSQLGGSPLPPIGLSTAALIPPTAIGATAIEVTTLIPFASSGWIQVGSQAIRYTAPRTEAGRFYLEGIPATGVGSITASIPPGSVVTAGAALLGVTALPPASSVAAIAPGDEIHLLVIEDDAAAQAAIASTEGGDGIIEHYIQDRRLSETGARARALADLALFKAVETKITYSTYDPLTRSGKTIHVDLPAPTNLTGDFLIQRVMIDQVSIARGLMPRRQVEASSTRLTFDQVLQRLLMEDY